EFDGRSWATAFMSIDQALSAEEGEVMPASRHYWIREGELAISMPIQFFEGQYQRIYGGFRGDEPSAAHRERHRWTRVVNLPSVDEPYIHIAQAQSIVVDGLAFRDISPYLMTDPVPASIVRVEQSQTVR